MKHWRLLMVISLLALLMTPTMHAQQSALTIDDLVGLDFDTFLEASYNMILQRNPELLIELGLQDALGSDEVQLNDISMAYVEETDALVATIAEQLQTYDRASLSDAQQLSYDIYAWYLDDWVQSSEFNLFQFPVTFFITSVQSSTINFFTEIHPMVTPQDARDYVTRLWLVDDKFAQAAANIDLQTAAGIIPPRFVIQWTMGELNQHAGGRVQRHDYYATFATKIETIEGLSATERDELLAAAQDAVENAVMPAYQQLADTLSALQAQAPTDVGVWQYPNGEAYYEYMLRHFTTTDMTADEIHELGLQELDRIHAEMRVRFEELGYPADASIAQLYQRLGRSGQVVSARDVVPTFEAILVDAQANITDAFSHVPTAEVVVIGNNFGGYYIPGALDGSRPGAFYAANTNPQPYYNMASLLYHETVPGHHLQIAWAQELDLPSFRRGSHFTAYVEGWALYAERLAVELGWYDGDPQGDLGRLQYEAFRAARLVVDTGIHAQGWTFDEAVNFFAENTGFPVGMAQGQIARYVVWPGQSTSYMIGMLKILDLRDQMQAAQGADFDLIAFHDIVLDNGSVPLALLEQIVDHTITP